MLRTTLFVLLSSIGCDQAHAVAPDAGSPDATLDAASSGIGAPCTAANPFEQGTCADGQQCASESLGFPGGACTEPCDTTACPSDAVCAAIGGSHYCGVPCGSDTDCRTPDYRCQPAPEDTTLAVCLPTTYYGSPTPGTNGGRACVAPIASPPGQGRLFGADIQVSDNTTSAECELAVDASSGHVVVAYIAIGGTAARIGVASSADDGATFAAPQLLPADTTVDTNKFQSDPVVAIAPNGTFYVAWIGFDDGSTNMRVWGARSSDGGTTWQVFAISNANEWSSATPLDKPWLAASPMDGSLSVTWTRVVGATSDIRYTRSADGGATWSPAATISDTSTRPSEVRGLAQVAYRADGKPFVVWGEAGGDPNGSTANQAYLQRMNADGTRSGANVLVTGGGDAPAADDPSIAVRGNDVYVGFVSGAAIGGWDIRVAASSDGGATFAPSVKVNSDATCATHLHHQLAIDGNGAVHAIWYDNRYLTGNVFHAAAPTGSALAFGANTFVNDTAFGFATWRNQPSWLGDYLGFAIVGQTMYAAWTDPRDAQASHIRFTKGTAP